MRGVNASESRRCGARINSRSNSASTVSIKRPCAVIVSAHAPARDGNLAFFFSVIVASVFNRSRVERVSRSTVAK
jgi:hypothetical protein